MKEDKSKEEKEKTIMLKYAQVVFDLQKSKIFFARL